MLPRLFCAVDLRQMGLVDESFLKDVYDLAVRHATPAVLLGGTSTSLEAQGTSVNYRLLNGTQISEVIPDLTHLYEDELVQLASRLTGEKLLASPEMVNGVNLNVLNGGGGRYEWHVDSNPVTGLLVLSDCDEEVGGRLLFERDHVKQTAFCMRPGHFLVFDATQTPHAVEVVRGPTARVTAPMNFFVAGEEIVRPPDLDRTLYV